MLSNVIMNAHDFQPKYYLALRTKRAARKLLAYYNRVLEPLGLTTTQALALGVLWNGEEISLGEFAKRAGIGKAAAVAMIQRLTVMGCVTTSQDPHDARKNIIRLTDAARKNIPLVYEKVRQLEEKLENAIGRESLNTVIEALGIIEELDL